MGYEGGKVFMSSSYMTHTYHSVTGKKYRSVSSVSRHRTSILPTLQGTLVSQLGPSTSNITPLLLQCLSSVPL